MLSKKNGEIIVWFLLLGFENEQSACNCSVLSNVTYIALLGNEVILTIEINKFVEVVL